MKNIKKQIIVISFFAAIVILWQLIAMSGMFSEILFPSVDEILLAFVNGIATDHMLLSAGNSLVLILKGLGLGIVLTMILTSLAILSKSFQAIFNALIAIFDPLPGVAMIPLAIVWFGITETSIMFLMIHGILWPMSRSILDGVKSIPKIYVEVGENIGLKTWRLVRGIYLPACFPYILTGLKTGWARAWRALISVEMIFGLTQGVGGIGYYIFERRFNLDMAGVFASLIVIILIGLIIEYGVFAQVEKRTIKKWGMVR